MGNPKARPARTRFRELAEFFVRAIRGSYSGVVGLPVFETVALLAQFGIEILSMVDDQ